MYCSFGIRSFLIIRKNLFEKIQRYAQYRVFHFGILIWMKQQKLFQEQEK